MKKILLLATGGTIASIHSKEGLAPVMTDKDIISYLPKHNSNITIESKMLMNIDSTNMQPESWIYIAETIYRNYSLYDGFVITHGTDTMAYTSSALSYMLEDLCKPVVLTGSQIPISFEQTDARKNISDAFRFACEEIGGVFVVFDGKVICGTRAVKLRTKSYDAFESINYPYIASINEPEVNYHQNLLLSTKRNLKLKAFLNPDVFLLRLYPGMKPELFDTLSQLYKGIVIESFGNGGVPFQGRNLLPKLKGLTDLGIAVVITTQCLEEGENLYLYEVGRRVAQDKIILSGDMNTEAIIPKLMWVLGQTNNLEDIKEMIETPIAGDRNSNFINKTKI